MNTSKSIGKLARAFSAAQKKITGAEKNAENETIQTRYADLSSVWQACREALTENGLAVLQSPRLCGEFPAWGIEVETMLMHSSGQWITGVLRMPGIVTHPQMAGESITYAKRYSLAAFVGVPTLDDDGQALRVDASMATSLPLRVASAEVQQSKRGAKKWQVVLSDGRAFTVTNHLVGAHAVELAESQALVYASVLESRWKTELTGFTEADAPAEPPIDVDEASIPH